MPESMVPEMDGQWKKQTHSLSSVEMYPEEGPT